MNLKKQAIKGVIWTFTQQFSVQIINFIVQVVLARLLMPEDFGLIAMIAVFVAIGQSLSDGGMTSSLIQNNNNTEKDYGTVFLTNLFFSTLIYIIVFSLSPLVARFYNQPILSELLRVYGITFVISAFYVVQVAKFTKDLNFKLQFIYQIPSVVIGALTGLVMAYAGLEVWSLVGLNISQAVSFSLILWFFYKWKPKMIFDRKVFKKHFNYGYKLTISSLLTNLYLNLYKIVIGKKFSVQLVGYFTNADNLRQLPISQMSNVLNTVTFPVFARIQNDNVKLKRLYIDILSLALAMSSVLMLILILVANPMYILIFGEKWLAAVPYFKILCIASIFLPINMYNLNILKVKGRTDLYLKVDVIKKIIGIVVLIISIPFGIEAIVWSLCITNIFFAYLNGYFSGKLINYRLLNQVVDTLKIILISLIPFAILYYIQQVTNIFNMSSVVELISMPLLYLVIYIPVFYFLNKKKVQDFKIIIKNIRK
ncbi:O-antigen/teichoic acid export membrane protein [Tenacibaculum sp. 190524A02b]|uniref:lipopolysaccharide biosynthesis protein n=1 Tax=Tenacibaculum vairaonense TaxID=3137860 RepID=UPI0032B11D3F